MKPIADVNEMRKIQMDILLFIHQFCIDNGIQYSLAWGTMLGAIRHKGYIPFKQNGKWGILLANGTVKVKPKYYNIGPFINDRAVVQNTADSEEYYINGNLERIK